MKFNLEFFFLNELIVIWILKKKFCQLRKIQQKASDVRLFLFY